MQPRIRLTRSYDERHHSYLGYALQINGRIGDEAREFLVGVGKGAHAKHNFSVGCEVSGECEPVADARLESVEFYKVSGLTVLNRKEADNQNPPPWRNIPPDLTIYRERGHRRLDARTYDVKCWGCIWGCRMAVEMIVDHWNPSRRRYRYETFCYGPKICSFYKSGPTRKVPGRNGMSYEEADWVDEESTAHRQPLD